MKCAFLSSALWFMANIAVAEPLDCAAPVTTVDINRCTGQTVERAEATLDKYLQASLRRNAENSELTDRINASQTTWQAYREAHCGAIYEALKDGTLRGTAAGQCQLRMTRERIYELWQSWLTLGDASSPVLPDPSVREAAFQLDLTDDQLAEVGQKIFQNECAGNVDCLVHWNRGEAFPSLGIGHFIWYPTGVDGRFVESFPDLVAFMQARSADLPGWLTRLEPLDAPWPDREAFIAAQGSEKIEGLRRFLNRTKHLQAEFMFRRAERSMTRVVEAAPTSEQAAISQRLKALAATPGGVYALIDYVNFKGEGLSASERYDGEGWGLLQVLQHMPETQTRAAVDLFRQSAAEVLTRRAENAPRAIEKAQWLPGWLKRVETYRE
ncbi:lysozyme inhibitor LprI family protein [Marinobacter fonticola]|uniref:lysozyme inhibitor LprI family protein n=1 Tax=Marinobacter fonticola TaxID=2603215 RepID=UPI00143D21AF|nr:lysozyme inhibitor LprI family protein [Marinobacter fonticola]